LDFCVGVFVCKLLACVLGRSCVFGSSSNLFNKLQTGLRVYTEVCNGSRVCISL
jgi:hypothetical protein